MKMRDCLLAGLVLVTGFVLYDRSRIIDELRALRLAIGSSRPSATERAHHSSDSALDLPRPKSPPDSPSPTAGHSSSPQMADSTTGPVAPSMVDRIAYLEMAFDRQSEDRSWANSATLRLEQGLSRVSKDSRGIGRIECKSSLCRAHYDSSDPSACEEFIRGSVHQAAPYFWEGPYIVKRDEVAGGRGCGVSMMFGREGMNLPTIE